jgi:AcrR family transcriptional regulator
MTCDAGFVSVFMIRIQAFRELTCGTLPVDFQYTPTTYNPASMENRPAESATRQKLTAAAVRRFYRDGFRSVGLDQVLTDVGISKTAFYKHFASKEDLVLAALDAQNRWLQGAFLEMIRDCGGGNFPIEQLRGLLDVVDQIIDADEYQGCIFVNVALEFPLPHEPAHIAAAQHKQAIEKIVCDIAAQAGATDPSAMAAELCMIMEGAYVTRQVTGKRETIEIARRLANRVIDAHLLH